ncbi:MAG TPA: hypothetical protein VJ867_12875 [Gemmatimonadaceae bacterium]|nr:hypothetical protein [Gemmatimonadaceae bacterium]
MDLQVVSVAISMLQLILTGVLAWIVHRSTSRITRLEFAKSIRDAWVTLDALALGDPETLKIADSLLHKPGDRPDADAFARKRWFILAYLNPIVTAYQGARDGLYGDRRKDVIRGVQTQLESLLRDDDAFWITQHHGHEASFQALCRVVRERIEEREVSTPRR